MEQLRKLEDLRDYSLQARDGDIGKATEAYFDDRDWVVRYFVVRTGGWMLGHEVLIAPRAIIGLDEQTGRIAVDLTRAQVEKSPPVDTKKPVSRHYETEYHRYYSWEPYWMAEPPSGPGPITPRAVSPSNPEPLPEAEHPHLRASREVRGYGIRASDGDLGEVHDFVVDDHHWAIRYVVVDTRKWLPGKKVLVAPAWVNGIQWAQRALSVDLDRETIRSAPPYDPSQVIGREYEVSLYAHYGKAMQGERRYRRN